MREEAATSTSSEATGRHEKELHYKKEKTNKKNIKNA
jgi:hypothetical protein